MRVSYQEEEELEKGGLPFLARLTNFNLHIKASITKESESCGSLNSLRQIEGAPTALDVVSQRSIVAESDPLRAIHWNVHFHSSNSNNNLRPQSVPLGRQQSSLDQADLTVERHLGVAALQGDPAYSMSRYLLQQPSRLTQLALHDPSGPTAPPKGRNKASKATANSICFKAKSGCEQGMEQGSLVAFAGSWAQYVLVHIVDFRIRANDTPRAGRLTFQTKILSVGIGTCILDRLQDRVSKRTRIGICSEDKGVFDQISEREYLAGGLGDR